MSKVKDEANEVKVQRRGELRDRGVACHPGAHLNDLMLVRSGRINLKPKKSPGPYLGRILIDHKTSTSSHALLLVSSSNLRNVYSSVFTRVGSVRYLIDSVKPFKLGLIKI